MNIFDILLLSLKYYTIHNIIFFGVSLIIFLIDISQIFKNYKIQQKPSKKIIGYYKKCLPTVLYNMLIMLFPATTFLAIFTNFYSQEFNIIKLIFDFIIGMGIVDILFYFFHRIFHTKMFYSYHKQHHELTAPVCIGAAYASVSEFYLADLLPIYAPMILLSSDNLTVCIWIALTTFSTVGMAHSGFKRISQYHDRHHTTQGKNYGLNLFMDRLFKTKY